MTTSNWAPIQKKLSEVYPSEGASDLVQQIRKLTAGLEKNVAADGGTGFDKLSERDLCLITYANSITSSDKTPLATLTDFITRYGLDELLPDVHILPFYPWDTDRGFSVKDYYEVNPDYGTWDDCLALAKHVRLMYDFVANHASVENPLVQKALIVEHLDEDDPDYQSYLPYKDFVVIYSEENRPSDETLKSLARPRAFPVLTKYRVVKNASGAKAAILGAAQPGETVLGSGYVWTTFSRAKRADGTEDTRQVDLNFRNPAVFLETIKILLFYVEKKGVMIRLDAIGYLWKHLGSSSLHEPECHKLIEVLGDVLRLNAPQAITIAEVNEPQEKAFLYVGTKEHPEADMAYQFSHFSLAIHAVLTGKARYYSDWIETTYDYGGRQFTTALGSHDGLAMKQARELLPEDEFEELARILVEEHSGLANMAILPGGKTIVYEVCATPWNLINNPNVEEDFEVQLNRYLAVTALGLQVPGIPALYFQGLFGAKNYFPEGGLDENRTVNREAFKAEQLYPKLDDPQSHEARVLKAVKNLCAIRQKQPAFNPHTGYQVLKNASPGCVSVLLEASDSNENIITVVNVSASEQALGINLDGNYRDIVSGHSAPANLAPYQVCWLKAV